MNDFLNDLKEVLAKHKATIVANEVFDEFENLIGNEIVVQVGKDLKTFGNILNNFKINANL